jgi:hypothetical protein
MVREGEIEKTEKCGDGGGKTFFEGNYDRQETGLNVIY